MRPKYYNKVPNRNHPQTEMTREPRGEDPHDALAPCEAPIRVQTAHFYHIANTQNSYRYLPFPPLALPLLDASRSFAGVFPSVLKSTLCSARPVRHL